MRSSKWFLKKLVFWLSWKLAKMDILHYNNQAASYCFSVFFFNNQTITEESIIKSYFCILFSMQMLVHCVLLKVKTPAKKSYYSNYFTAVNRLGYHFMWEQVQIMKINTITLKLSRIYNRGGYTIIYLSTLHTYIWNILFDRKKKFWLYVMYLQHNKKGYFMYLEKMKQNNHIPTRKISN
jgi:hypothetical protein